jgi:hypothetical protein
MRPTSMGAICGQACMPQPKARQSVLKRQVMQTWAHAAHWSLTLLNVSACMSKWSASHSGQESVMVTVTDRWFVSLLQRPYRRQQAGVSCWLHACVNGRVSLLA